MGSWKRNKNMLSQEIESPPQDSQKYGMWGQNSVYVTVGETQNLNENLFMQEIEETTEKEEMRDMKQIQTNKEKKEVDSWNEKEMNNIEGYKEYKGNNENNSAHVIEPNMSAQNMTNQSRGCFVNGSSQQRSCQFPSMYMQKGNDAMFQSQYMENMRNSNMGNGKMAEFNMCNGVENRNMAGMRMGNGMTGCVKNGIFNPLESSENFTIGMGYVPMQHWEQTYNMTDAIKRGTIFPSLDLPFMMGRCQ